MRLSKTQALKICIEVPEIQHLQNNKLESSNDAKLYVERQSAVSICSSFDLHAKVLQKNSKTQYLQCAL